MGLGSLAGALVVASRPRATLLVILLGAAGFSLAELAVAASGWYPLALVLLAGLGIASILFTTGVNTTLQLNSPPQLRGRVMSLFTLFFLGSTTIGGLVTGAPADLWGVQRTLAFEALVCGSAVLAAALYLRLGQGGPRLALRSALQR